MTITTIFELGVSSFILSPIQSQNRDPSIAIGWNFHHEKAISSISKKIITRIASSSVSSPDGNITAPSQVSPNSNTNELVEIPIIGPLLNVHKPIIVGDSIWLDPPTPLQWKTIEASVEAKHGGSIFNWISTTVSNTNEMVMSKINLATTDQSPLVAILHNGGKDYATIAAVEGILTKNVGSIDTSDSESFRESLASLNSPYYSDSSKVRLFAIGRAKISHHQTKFLTGGFEYDDNQCIGSTDINSFKSEPLLVARMGLLLDSDKEGNKKSSPVHALNRISSFAQRVRLLHDDRQHIVRGLQAAQSRLEIAMEKWADWDGIGSLNANKETDTSTESNSYDLDGVLNQFIREYDTDERGSLSIPTHSLPLSPSAARCIELDNYGLGTTSSAYVPLPSMVNIIMERLEKYYSPERLQSEEFEYECLSWCTLQSLQTYLSSEEIHEALYECTNTCDRLQLLYEGMLRHKTALTELAVAKSTELRNCGEECDLF